MVFEIKDAYGVYQDITPYIAYNGLKWSRNDVEAANAGRMQEDGNMERDRVAIKYRWDVTCRPLTATEQAFVLTLINPVFMECRYTDPLTNTVVEDVEYYSNNIPSAFMVASSNGTEWWTGLAFPLVQK